MEPMRVLMGSLLGHGRGSYAPADYDKNHPHPLTPAQMCSIFLGMRMKPDPPKKGAGRPRRPVPPAHLDPDAAPSREEEILAFIAGSLRERGYPPTIREIGKAFGIASTNGVRYYLDRLEQSGKIRRDRW